MNTISLPLSGDLNRTKVKTSQTIYMHHRLLQLTVQEAHSYISEHSPGVDIIYRYLPYNFPVVMAMAEFA